MKVTLLTDLEGMMMYKEGRSVFEAAAKHAETSVGFVHEVQVDVEEIQTRAKRFGHVYVQRKADEVNEINGETSDGYHTFDELYYHRMILFSVICNQNKERAFKSTLHHDGTMYENYFIVGLNTPEGQYTYHYHMDHWDKFDVLEMDYAPEWDGHKPNYVTRLLSLL